jgi:DNA repair exonuclease SbcCD ATPase subunit
MAKEIGIKLNITSQGEQRVIKNLNELEAELQSLQGQLRTLDFGSEAFKKTAAEIANLKSQIDNVDKATEGIGAEKRFRALGDAVNILTGSFQVLSGALGLVITDSEDLEAVQKAETQALQVLNVALGINAINTALVESATLRATIATKALTAAQTIFNNVIKASPFNAVVIGLTAIAAAVFGLVKAYQALSKPVREYIDVENEVVKISDDAIKSIGGQITKLQFLQRVVADETRSEKERKKALDELKTLLPELETLTLRQADAIDKVAIAVGREIGAIKERAKVGALEAQLTKAISDNLAIEENLIAVSDGLITSTEEFRTALLLNRDAFENSNVELRNAARQYLANEERISKYSAAIDGSTEALKFFTKEDSRAASSTTKTNDILDARTKLLISQNRLLQDAINKLGILGDAELEYTADILKFQEKVLQDQESLIQERSGMLEGEAEQLIKRLDTLLRRTIPNAQELDELTDNYQEIFDTIGLAYETTTDLFKQPLNFDELIEAANKVRAAQGQELFGEEVKLLSPSSQAAIVDFFNNIRDRVAQIRSLGGVLPGLSGLTDQQIVVGLSKLEDDLFEIAKTRIAEGKTQLEVKEEITDRLEKQFGFSAKIAEIDEQIVKEKSKGSKANNLTIQELEKQKTLIEGVSSGVLESVNKSLEFYKGIESVSAEAKKNTDKIKDNVEDITRSLNLQEEQQVFKFIEDNLENIDTLIMDLFDNLDSYTSKISKSGLEQIFSILDKGIKKADESSIEGLENIKEYLEVYIQVGKVLGQDTEAAEKLLEQVNNKLGKLNLEGFFKDLNDGLGKATDQLFSLVDRYYDTLQQRSSLTLEQITRDEEAALAAIDEALKQSGANTKRLEEERSAITKKAAQERFEIEKKSRINELKFSLAQVISDSALAITNVLASVPVPLNFVLAGTTGALALGQVAAVRDQLTFVQSQQFIGRRGGLITGESHEGSNGGVPAMLEGGEFVVNRAAVSQYGDLIGELNSSTGGRRLSIDDSRLVQAIASQNSSTPPLKAYVLYNDIQSTEKLNNKITQLARL